MAPITSRGLDWPSNGKRTKVQMSTRQKPVVKRKQPKPRRKPVRRQTKIPAAVAVISRPRAPKFSGRRDGGVIIKHSELSRNVIGSIIFAINNAPVGFAINPGNEDLFPWLTSVAMSYETYRFRKLHFRYEPLVPTTSPGAVYLAVDYDAAEQAPGTKYDMMAYKSATRGSVWSPFNMPLAASDLGTSVPARYTLDHYPITTQIDIRMYNLGNLFIGAEGCESDGAVLGEIWVDYEVELFTPQKPAEDLRTAAIEVQGPVSATSTLTVPNQVGTAAGQATTVEGSTDPLLAPLSQNNPNGNSFTILKPGSYTMAGIVNCTGGDLTAVLPTITAADPRNTVTLGSTYVGTGSTGVSAGGLSQQFQAYLNAAVVPAVYSFALGGVGVLANAGLNRARYVFSRIAPRIGAAAV